MFDCIFLSYEYWSDELYSALISVFIYLCPCPVWGVGSYIYLDIYFILHGKPFLRTEVP